MTYRPQTRSHGNSGRQVSKAEKEQKAKERKQRAAAKQIEEQAQLAPQDIVQKTLSSLDRLGNQVFALSPFSHYFDDWLVNMRQVISEFESNSNISADEQFVKERTQIFLDVEGALAEKRVQESSLDGEAKELADNNHLLVETDKEYAERTRQLSIKRNADVQRLSTDVRQLEDSVASQEQIRLPFYKFNAKSQAAETLAKTREELKSRKNELEVTLSSFTADQEKLHDAYEQKKQQITERIESLHKTLESLEIDTSVEPRQAACKALIDALNSLVQRIPPSAEQQ